MQREGLERYGHRLTPHARCVRADQLRPEYSQSSMRVMHVFDLILASHSPLRGPRKGLSWAAYTRRIAGWLRVDRRVAVGHRVLRPGPQRGAEGAWRLARLHAVRSCGGA